MGRYLVVARQTAASPELHDKLKEVASDDPQAEFVLLVPATPPRHLLSWVEGEARAAAQKACEVSRAILEQNGLRLSRVAVGDEAPVIAVQDDLRENPSRYEAIILSTFPLGISRWLGLDVLSEMERRFEIPIIHVVAKAGTATSAER